MEQYNNANSFHNAQSLSKAFGHIEQALKLHHTEGTAVSPDDSREQLEPRAQAATYAFAGNPQYKWATRIAKAKLNYS